MSESRPDPWHFAHPELARKYLQTFEIGLISAQALFAPRRMGKSEFLEQDLVPAAQKSGLLTAYLNLWDAREHPRGALISALARADRRLLLILDEAQVLASPAHSDLAHSLRAALDIRKQTIKVVFAGSSESSLRRMFGRATEPFYNWAPIEPFERLGAEFVTRTRALSNGCASSSSRNR
jgi:predicted AAA+ superfamily ATPase